jgi:hypothetical protein
VRWPASPITYGDNGEALPLLKVSTENGLNE